MPLSMGLLAFTGDYADWAKTLIYLCEMTFSIILAVGSVKGGTEPYLYGVRLVRKL